MALIDTVTLERAAVKMVEPRTGTVASPASRRIVGSMSWKVKPILVAKSLLMRDFNAPVSGKDDTLRWPDRVASHIYKIGVGERGL